MLSTGITESGSIEENKPIPVMPAMKEWAEKHGLKVTTK